MKWLVGFGVVLLLAAFAGVEPAQGYVLFVVGIGAIVGVSALFEKSGAIDPSGAKKENWVTLIAYGIALVGAIMFTFWLAKNLGWP